MVTSDEIPSEIVSNITKHLYSEHKIYQLIMVYTDVDNIPKYNFRWPHPIYHNKCVILKFNSKNDLNGWLFAFNDVNPSIRFHTYKSVITHKRGGIDMLNLRAVCKAFGRQPLQNIIGKYDLQFQRGLYSFILYENLRINENWIIFPDHEKHPYYYCKKTWYGIFVCDRNYHSNNTYLYPGINANTITYTPGWQIKISIKAIDHQYIIGKYPATLNPVFNKIDNVIANMGNRALNNNRSRNTYNNRKIVNNLPIKKIKNKNNFMPISGSRKTWHR